MPNRLRRRAVVPILAALLIFGASACTGSAPSFDPAGPCIVNGTAVDGRVTGAYPELEALIPQTLDGRGPNRLDSGRNCSERNLGTMAARGIREVRFGGGLWEVGQRSGVSLAVFRGDGLTTPILFEFYETGARTAPKTDATEVTDVVVGGVPGRRVDTLNDESYQSVIVWTGADGAVRVILVGSDVRETQARAVHEERITTALAAFTAAR
jgi:hypothetical protein